MAVKLEAAAGGAAALPVSVLLLARDEAPRLDGLLPKLGFARDVVVVVDASSRDGTRQVSEGHGARVYERTLDGFGAQRQFALEQCREPWVLWLDADEELDADAENALRVIVGGVQSLHPGSPAGYRVARHTWFLGRRIRWCGWRGERVLRLFRRGAARFDDAPVHERVHVQGSIGEMPGAIEHRSYESWADCREKLFAYSEAGAESARRAGRRAGPIDLLARPPLRFLRMYVLQGGVLDGPHGLAVCALGAAQVLLKYAELWADPDGKGRAR